VSALAVGHISGDVSPAGDIIHLRIEAGAHTSHYCLAPSDLNGLVNMLVFLGSRAPRPQAGGAEDSSPDRAIFAATSLSVGESMDGQALLAVEVGCVELTFSLPKPARAALARTMLAAAADSRLAT
jgi:hypothetical protein